MPTYLVSRRGPVTTLPVTGETKSQYVPHAVQLPNGHLWCVVKGDESRSIHAYRSTDAGATWQYQGLVIAPTGGSHWDGFACLDPVMVYDSPSDTIHYLWKGNQTHTGYGGWSVGHGTAPGSNPMTLTRDPANPILTSAQVLAYFPQFGSIGDLYMADVVKDPWGVLTFWGGFRDASGVYHLFRCRGDWNTFSPRVEGQVHPTSPWTHVQAPCVIQHPQYPVSLDAQGNGVGRYLLLFTEGHDSQAAGSLHQMSAWCFADGNWNWQRTGQVCLSNDGSGWDGQLAYAASLLKTGSHYALPAVLNGAWQLFYSGAPNPPTTAQAGIAELIPIGETAVIG